MKKTQDVFTILEGRVKLTAGGYKPTSDAMWLAAAAETKGGSKVLDVGVGTGAVSLCLLEKNPGLKITGVDISEKMIGDAAANAKLNGREMELLSADIFTWKTNRQFDLVITNPPYFSGTARKDGAHHNADIYEWTAACVRRLRPRGVFYAIVPPAVMDKVIAALYDGKCGGLAIRPIVTSNGIARLVISARLGVKTPARILM